MKPRAFVLALAAVSLALPCSAQSPEGFDTHEWRQVFDGRKSAWARRAGLEVVELNDAFYLMGGRTALDRNIPFASFIWADVWRSTDRGRSWDKIADRQWPARAYFEAVTKDQHMYVLGGQDFGGPGMPSNFYADVWRSADGIQWDLMTAQAGWAGRAGHTAVVFKDHIYVLGGSQGDDIATGGTGRVFFNDVWRSADGVTWELVTAQAPWDPRAGAAVVVQGDRLVLVGGEAGFFCQPFPFCDPPYFNDVWSSKDGATWKLETASAPWSKRPGHHAVVLDGRIVMFGGYGLLQNPVDMWVSRKGSEWRQLNPAPWNAMSPDEIKYDFDVLAVPGKRGRKSVIFTFGGDRERFELPPQVNFNRLDDDVWWFGPSGW